MMSEREFKKYAVDAYARYLSVVMCPQCERRDECDRDVTDFSCDYVHVAFRRLAELHELLAKPITLTSEEGGE